MIEKPIIWFIDENSDQLETYKGLLEHIFAPEGVVNAIEPAPSIEEMKYIVDNPNTVSVIIDERLKDTGIANYLGIDLATYFRTLDTKLPIYILTNHIEDTEDLDPGRWSVEDVIEKDTLFKEINIYQARMVRNISFYKDYLGERERRFDDLLRKSLDESITDEELREFKEIQYIRAKNLLADELTISPELETMINKYLSIISKLEK